MKRFVTLDVGCGAAFVGALQHGCSKRIGLGVCSKLLLGDFISRQGFGGRRVETQAVDLRLQVAGREVAVDLGGDAGIAVAEDALDRGGIGAGHHEQAGSGVAQVMEANLADLCLRPEQMIVHGATALNGVWDALGVGAALLAADVRVELYN
ncbi:MAG TPA: hypothetical protein VGC79_30375, partial [Polyangiaceae bacterium]